MQAKDMPIQRSTLRRQRSSLPSVVLVGHDVYNGAPPKSACEANVAIRLEKLIDTIEAIRRAGYMFVSDDEFIRERRSGGIALLTFDDAYRSVRDVAAPALKSLGVPAVIFVVTGAALGQTDPFPIWLQSLRDFVMAGGATGDLENDPLVRSSLMTLGYRHLTDLLGAPLSISFSKLRLGLSQDTLDQIGVKIVRLPGLGRTTMNRAELKQLIIDYGFSLGAHSVSHRSFAQLSTDDAVRDIEASALALETITGRPAKESAFAYPFGAVTARSSSGVARAFAAGFSCQPRPIGPLDHSSRLPRINLDDTVVTNMARSDRTRLAFLGLRETSELYLRGSFTWRFIVPPARVLRQTFRWSTT